MTASTILDETYVLVQFARTLPPTDDGWISTTRLDVTSISEGLGPVLGDCRLEQVFGVRTEAMTRRWRDLGQAPDFGRRGDSGSINDTMAGALVRLLANTDGGAVTVDGATFTPFWWGVCTGPTSEPDGESTAQVGGAASWTCVSLASVLDQVTVSYGYSVRGYDITPAVSNNLVRTGFCPPFDRNRSAATYATPGGTTYLHDLSIDPTGTHYQWTAAEILQYLLAVHMRPWDFSRVSYSNTAPSGWEWSVSDPDNCLAYVPDKIDVQGKTVFQAINYLASQDRGCTWYVTVTDDVATIHIVSTTATEIVVGDTTIPASTYTATLDHRDDGEIGSVQISEDWDSTYDIIEVHGARPWRGLTLKIESPYEYVSEGWLPDDETSWGDDFSASGTEHVWRRFLLRPAWFGAQYNSTTQGLRNALLTAGDNSYTGARQHDGSSSAHRPPAWLLELTRLLPCSPNFGTAPVGDRQAPVIVSGTGSDWTDRSQQWQLQLSTDWLGSPPSIRLDDGKQGTLIQEIIEGGESILVTLGFREVDPLLVSWCRPRDEWPNATPRRKVHHLPECEEWTICSGSVSGVNSTGTGLTTTGELVIRDDLEKLEAALALLVAGSSEPHVTVSWNRRGTLDIGTSYRPGRMLTTVTQGDRTQTVNAVITRRTWTQTVQQGDGDGAGEVAYWVTSYQSQRLPPSIEALKALL